MAIDRAEQLNRIAGKAKLLLIRYEAMRKHVDELNAQIQELKAQMMVRDAEIEKLNVELEYLSVASRITPNRESKEAAKAIISNLVREIDNCIADLND